MNNQNKKTHKPIPPHDSGFGGVFFTFFKRNSVFFIFLIILLIGCASENPELVNPTPASKTVDFRMLNLSSNTKPLSLLLGYSVESNLVYYSQLTPSVKPPLADSMYISIKMDGTEVKRTPTKFRFVRDTKYVVVTLPKADGVRIDGPPDTTIIIETSFGLPEYSKNAFVSLVNVFPDSSSSYDLVFGCPNGTSLAGGIMYRGFSLEKEIPSGRVNLSLTKTAGGVRSLVGLYSMDLAEHTEYAFFVIKNADGVNELWRLDLRNFDPASFQKLQPNFERAAQIRVLNFSVSDVTVQKDLYNAAVPSKKISSYKNIEACASDTADIFQVYSGGLVQSYAMDSLEVGKRYTVLVFDSAALPAKLSMIAAPEILPAPQGNNAVLRFVHAAYLRPSLTLSLAARKDNSASGYKAGEIVALNIFYGEISSPVLVSPGSAPFTLFTSKQPANMLTTSLSNIEPGKSYLVVATNQVNGSDTSDILTIIEDNTESTDLIPLPPAIFTQIFNAVSGIPSITVAVNDITGARLYYNDWLAVVINENTSVNVNGSLFNLTLDKAKRGLLVASGNGSVADLFNVSEYPMGTATDTYRRRFVNACTDVPNVLFTVDDEPANDLVVYKNASIPRAVTREGKVSVNAINNDNMQPVYRVNAIDQLLGKNYTLIFSGNSAAGYSFSPLQEY